ncbi:AAA family ATPase [Aquibacillus koreensis]|uniref:Nuclease SbcCD subunit C n=1 Tax=Aquibacillus koreensis TaxID=279446 RepID=A0A9X4AK89_9BACI|nr:AAA family ATPase [Aquibacillus koreensis]MCT2535047.1 AAA family ATPase [Aquibacillus koreensis]MDC3422831.1 AAA family ATPase [Aquibacillus koreensis]
MRAITLTLHAFGPYSKEQTINFNDLGDESIFLITGPTGAGKTTIFDAICYALYGRASGSDRDQDSLRSHFANTDEPTSVAFTFQLKDKTYEVTRYPRQLKRKERGEGFTEDPARAELYEIVNQDHQLISAKIKDVNETLEQMLGLDYEQFRKMIMIPQGEFRRLISENSKEREEILQKIFHTHFYERITDELKKQAKELREQIAQLQWKIDQEAGKIKWKYINVEDHESTDELLKQLDEEIKSTKKDKQQWSEKLLKDKEQLKAAQERYYKGKQLAEKFEEFNALNKKKANLVELEPFILTKKKTLDIAKKAEQIVPFENQVNERKQEWKEQQVKLENQQSKLKKSEEIFVQIKMNYEQELNREDERAKVKDTIETKKQQLDKLFYFTEIQGKFSYIVKEKETQQQYVKSIQEKVGHLTSQLEKIEYQLKDQNQWTKSFYNSEAKLKEMSDRLLRLKRLQTEVKTLDTMRADYQKVHHQYQEVGINYKQKKQELEKLEEQQKRNHAYYLAQHLHEGETCPVCGGVDHPNKAIEGEGSVSEEVIKKLKHEIEQIDKQLQHWQDKFVQVKSDGQAQRKLVEDMYKELKDFLSSQEEEEIAGTVVEWNERIKQSTEKHNEIKNHIAWMEEAEKKKEKLQKDKKDLEVMVEAENKKQEKINESYIRLHTQIESVKKELTDPQRDPNDLRVEINNQEEHYQKWMEQWEKLKKDYEAIKNNLQQERTVLEQLQEFVANTKQRYESQMGIFEQKINENEFESIESYKQAKRSTVEQEQMQKEIDDFERQQSSVEQRLVELAKQLNKEENPDLNDLIATVQTQETIVEQANQNFQSLVHHIEQHSEIFDIIEVLHEKYQNVSKQYYDIGELADLARGENHLKLSFERYVLSSFLDEILLQANLRLDQLTEHRYQLIRSDQIAKRGAQSGLDLEVLDHHTGQQRSVKTLSGGEGFKAALSLALGMADVVQAHAGGVQLDTLFIDEGFGTLDELSLEQAINCLKGLQQSNRILGIISHVPQLKEEIHAKLQITPSPQGSRAAFTF